VEPIKICYLLDPGLELIQKVMYWIWDWRRRAGGRRAEGGGGAPVGRGRIGGDPPGSKWRDPAN